MLITVIVLGIIILLLAQTLSTTGYFQRHGTLEFQSKELSYALAMSCLDKAMYSLSNDLDYTGGETVTLGGYQCTISTITYSGSNSTIITSATANGSSTTLKLVVDLYLDVVTFAEQ